MRNCAGLRLEISVRTLKMARIFILGEENLIMKILTLTRVVIEETLIGMGTMDQDTIPTTHTNLCPITIHHRSHITHTTIE